MIGRAVCLPPNEPRHWVTGHRWSSSKHCWFPAAWRLAHDRRTQRALGMEKLRERRSAAGSHPDPRGGGENAGWRAGGWLGSERRAGPSRAGTWRPTDLRCSSPAAESAPEYAIAAYNSGRSWWPLRRWLGQAL